jgi:membrane associated rhomboid family serine protease
VPIVRQEYFQVIRPPSGAAFKDFKRWSITSWLIAINIVVFFLNAIFENKLLMWGAFSINQAVYHLQLWRWITFQFLHDPDGVGHILWNMIGLYFFGYMVERYLGRRRFLLFYILCGLSGPVGMMGVYYLGLLPHYVTADMPSYGASAGVLGCIVGAACFAPDTTVLLVFIPCRLIVVAWIFIGIAVYTVMIAGANAGGEAAHLAGALVGFVLIKQNQWLNFADRRWIPNFTRAAPVSAARRSGKKIVFEEDGTDFKS